MLDRLRLAGSQQDERAKERQRSREVELGRRLDGRERADLYRDAPIAIVPDVGELLYVLALARRAERVVEFGTSLGFSTIHLAAALRDNGSGSLITTEWQHEKAQLAEENLIEAGLGDLVEIRVGDAMETLGEMSGDIDIVFLDGWNDLYLQVLELLEPHLRPGGLVIADLSRDDPTLAPYSDYVRDPGNGYQSIEIPLDAGVLLSVRTPS